MENNYVYVLEYSDYDGSRIVAIFDTKEKAHARLERIMHEFNNDPDQCLRYKFDGPNMLRECDVDMQETEAAYIINKYRVE